MTNPLVAQPHSSVTWYSGLGLVEDAEQVSNGIHDHSWVDETLGTVGGALDVLGAVIDPLGSMVSWGVAWLMDHVRPLKEALDWLAGNPDAVAAHATTWQNVSKLTAEARTQYMDAISDQVADWHGASGNAYRNHAGIITEIMHGIAVATHGLSYAVEAAGLLVGMVRGFVRDLISQFVATLAARLPQWLAEEGVTLGFATPLVVGQVAALVAKWVGKIQRFIRGLLNSLRHLLPKVKSLGEIIEGLKKELAKLLQSLPRSGRPGHDHNLGEPDPNFGSTATKGWQLGDAVPPPHQGNEIPTDAPLLKQYTNETSPDHPLSQRFGTNGVHYMDSEEREQQRLFIDSDGKLRSAATAELFDTAKAETFWSGSGRAIFVMDGSGNIYATQEQIPGFIHHSSLLAGEPVVGAGEIGVSNGKLVSMTDQSGHYKPKPYMNDLVLQTLRNHGLITSNDFKQYGWAGVER